MIIDKRDIFSVESQRSNNSRNFCTSQTDDGRNVLNAKLRRLLIRNSSVAQRSGLQFTGFKNTCKVRSGRPRASGSSVHTRRSTARSRVHVRPKVNGCVKSWSDGSGVDLAVENSTTLLAPRVSPPSPTSPPRISSKKLLCSGYDLSKSCLCTGHLTVMLFTAYIFVVES